MTDAIQQAIYYIEGLKQHYSSIGQKIADEKIKALKTHQSETVCVRVDELPEKFLEDFKRDVGFSPLPQSLKNADSIRYTLDLIAQKLQEKEERG